MSETPDMTRLVVLSPASSQGRTIPIHAGRTTVGRGQADIRLEESAVSRLHAALTAIGNRVDVEDLGSTCGTTVNGHAIRDRTPLRNGDMVAFGPVVMRFDESSSTAPNTAQIPSGAGPVHFTAGDQYAHQLNMVGGDQYNAYTHAIVAQRESFMREVAATRTRARRLVWFGVVLLVAGFAAFIVPLLRFLSQAGDASSSQQFNTSSDSPFSINGFPIGLIGWAVAAVGVFMIVIGIILHVAATARRRRVEQTLPLPPPPWFGPGSPQQPPATYRRY